jgi:hypothetical protein
MDAEDKAQNTITAQLRELMQMHGLSRSRTADVFNTKLPTLDHWLDQGTKPPGCLGVLLHILAVSEEARIEIGIHDRPKLAPRGRPFKRGNEFRFAKGVGSRRAAGVAEK